MFFKFYFDDVHISIYIHIHIYFLLTEKQKQKTMTTIFSQQMPKLTD